MDDTASAEKRYPIQINAGVPQILGPSLFYFFN